MIPIKAIRKIYSAIASNLNIFFLSFVLMAIKEKKQESMSIMAIPEVNSSIRLESDLFVK
ncbi:MAG: hypothetical protein AAGC65_00355 [Mucilaginibacter sp.]|uniref:hypothetical protein n=1 Tax=Mucilaginibacter sp. TaxID=1882438 RepID=UPI0031A17D75